MRMKQRAISASLQSCKDQGEGCMTAPPVEWSSEVFSDVASCWREAQSRPHAGRRWKKDPWTFHCSPRPSPIGDGRGEVQQPRLLSNVVMVEDAEMPTHALRCSRLHAGSGRCELSIRVFEMSSGILAP